MAETRNIRRLMCSSELFGWLDRYMEKAKLENEEQKCGEEGMGMDCGSGTIKGYKDSALCLNLATILNGHHAPYY